jgi:hypothetical protein
MKVIFLDFDGVLNHDGLDPDNRMERAHGENDSSVALFWEKCQLVQRICQQTGASIVLSTAWRHHFSQSVIEGWLAEKGLTAPIVGITQSKMSSQRTHEIRWYLEDNPDISRYVVLDDMDLRDGRFNLFIWCDPMEGLTEEQAEEAIAYLNEEEA